MQLKQTEGSGVDILETFSRQVISGTRARPVHSTCRNNRRLVPGDSHLILIQTLYLKDINVR